MRFRTVSRGWYPQKPALLEAKPVSVEIGIKDGSIVLVSSGNSSVPANYLVWTPDEARELAAKLLELADSLQRTG